MDQRLLQRTRYVLQKRARRTQTSSDALFEDACGHFLDWMDNHPVVGGLSNHLEKANEEVIAEFRDGLEEALQRGPHHPFTRPEYTATTLEEHAALCLATTRSFAECTGDKREHGHVVGQYAASLFEQNHVAKQHDMMRACRGVVDDLYDYIDEQIDGRNAVFGLLRKYKERSEHFHQHRLRRYANQGLEGRQPGERSLAVDLHEYLLNQGVEFFVEPATSSGEVDVVLREPEGRYLIADAKYVGPDDSPSRIRKKLSNGFHQVTRYCDDYAEPAGFLINFVNNEKRLRLELDSSDGLNYLRLGGKTVYYLDVRIADQPSASQSGKAEEVVVERRTLRSEVES